MAIQQGQTAIASDFISSSAGTGSAGQVPKLAASGRIDNSFISNLFGDGSDGVILLDGSNTFSYISKSGSTYTLTRDIFATTLTVNGGVILITGNWRIFCTIEITGAGTIKQDGNTGGNGSYQCGIVGGGGSIVGYVTSPAGGNGGSGNSSGEATGGTTANPSPASAITHKFHALLTGLLYCMDYAGISPYKIVPASSGNGGSSGGQGVYTGGGGGGGSGAGMVYIFARKCSGTFTIQAIGGNGGNGGNGGGNPGGGNDSPGSGGGGGNGGFAVVAYLVKTWSGSYILTGGTGGTRGNKQSGSNYASNGSNGSAGQSLEINLSASV